MLNYKDVDFCNRTVLLLADLSDIKLNKKEMKRLEKDFIDHFGIGKNKEAKLFVEDVVAFYKKSTKKVMKREGRLQIRRMMNIVDYIYSKTAHCRITLIVDFPKGFDTRTLALYLKKQLDDIVLRRKEKMGFQRDQPSLIDGERVKENLLEAKIVCVGDNNTLPTDEGLIRMANEMRKGDRIYLLNNFNNLKIDNNEEFVNKICEIGDTIIWDMKNMDEHKKYNSIYWQIFNKYEEGKEIKGDFPVERDEDTGEILQEFDQMRQRFESVKCLGPIGCGEIS